MGKKPIGTKEFIEALQGVAKSIHTSQATKEAAAAAILERTNNPDLKK